MIASKGAKSAKPLRVEGVPRTAAQAKKRGYKKVEVNPHHLSRAKQKHWTFVDSTGVKHGALGALGPGTSTGAAQTICYYDKNTGMYDDCHEI
jgi:hypothetical protein